MERGTKMETRRLWKILMVLLIGMLLSPGSFLSLAGPPASSLKALIISGQNNHDWKASSPILKQILEDTGLFKVDEAVSPPQGGDMSGFRPDFAAYQLVLLNYSGDDWPASTQKAFMDFVRAGGGVVVYHSADNSFPQWKEFNQIIGLGGWGNRDERSGPYVFWKDGKIVRDSTPGIGGFHGNQHAFLVVNRDTSHPITRGLPEKWMHAKDELYSLMRGPAENIHILATAYSDPAQNGTGRDEPVLFTVSYGKGRIFHTVLGHVMGESPYPSMDVGFIVTLQRGAEWAATAAVTQKIPGDFPGVYREKGTPDDVRQWKGFRPPDIKKILQKLSTYDYGQDEEILSQLRDYVRARRNSPESRRQVEEQLASFLESRATLPAKMAVCRHLREIGTSLSVPMLEKMLVQPDTSDLARYALEKITGDAPDRALTQALSKTKGKQRIGVIVSLGQRKAKDSVPLLEKMLSNPDPGAAIAAATSLGQIATPQAAETLSRALAKSTGQLRNQIASSLLECAEELRAMDNCEAARKIFDSLLSPQIPLPVRQAALKGKIACSGDEAGKMIIDTLASEDTEQHEPAISLVQDVFDESSIQEVSGLLASLPPASQVPLFAVLSHFRNKAVLVTAIRAAKSEDQAVRVAALNALKNVGDASTVELLAMHAAESAGEEQRTARNSLWSLRGEGVNQAVLACLVKLQVPEVQNELIMCVGERRIQEGLSLLTARARSSNTKIRLQAIKSLKDVATPSDLPQLVAILLSLKEERDTEEMANTIAAVTGKIPQPLGRARMVIDAFPRAADVRGRCALYRVLGKVGDDSSLPVLRKALAEGKGEEYDASVRALADWPSTTPREDLLQIARTTQDTVHQVLALRAYIRMTGMEPYRAPELATRELRDVLGLARTEEKKLILGTLPQFACKDALLLAESLLKEQGVEAEAKAAFDEITKKIGKED